MVLHGSSGRPAPSLARQTAALLAKQWALQRRAWLLNAFLVALPLLFNILLLVLQVLVDVELGGRDFRCGCACTSCCDWVLLDGSNSSNSSGAAGSYEWQCWDANPDRECKPSSQCSAWDDTKCGAQYSSYRQIAFCDIESPPVWPAMVQVPPDQYRPGASEFKAPTHPAAPPSQNPGNAAAAAFTAGTAPPITLLYTGKDRDLASLLTKGLMAQDAGVLGQAIVQ
ncbi:hypothetical protein FOA52_008973 [Chlamydomonas sp. UWO 241]|nr:hypothetical protein FOA52_008973 [Chlamydomonas sp. UWO 241]